VIDVSYSRAIEKGHVPRRIAKGVHSEKGRQNSDNYDVAPDGKQFLMFDIDGAEAGEPSTPRIVITWFEALRRLAQRSEFRAPLVAERGPMDREGPGSRRATRVHR
jgi:hypothetical protein